MSADHELPNAVDGLTSLERKALRAVGPNRGFRGGDIIFDVGPEPTTHADYDAIVAHPVYDTAMALAKPWIVGHPLVEVDGNVGSIDGEPHADAWFTELRTTALGREVVGDGLGRAIGGDGLVEDTLPSAFPALLVNGSRRGLARFLPHNLREVCSTITARLDGADVDELVGILPGPDFPTGGIVLDDGTLRDAYRTGRGEVRVRARTHLDRDDAGRARVVVTEIPYGTAKGGDDGLIIDLAKRLAEGKLPAANLTDESSSDGMALLVWVRPDNDPAQLERDLFRHSGLEQVLEIRMLAAHDRAPRTLPLLAAVDLHLAQRREHHRALGAADVDGAIRAELAALAERHGRDRRTEIVRV